MHRDRTCQHISHDHCMRACAGRQDNSDQQRRCIQFALPACDCHLARTALAEDHPAGQYVLQLSGTGPLFLPDAVASSPVYPHYLATGSCSPCHILQNCKHCLMIMIPAHYTGWLCLYAANARPMPVNLTPHSMSKPQCYPQLECVCSSASAASPSRSRLSPMAQCTACTPQSQIHLLSSPASSLASWWPCWLPWAVLCGCTVAATCSPPATSMLGPQVISRKPFRDRQKVCADNCVAVLQPVHVDGQQQSALPLLCHPSPMGPPFKIDAGHARQFQR